MPVTLNCSAKIMQICYDNDVIILRSNLEYAETIELVFNKDVDKCIDKCINIINNKNIKVEGNKAVVELLPGVSQVLKFN